MMVSARRRGGGERGGDDDDEWVERGTMARERRFDASRRAREGERDGDARGARREICVERRRRTARGDGARGGDGEDEGCARRRRPGGALRALLEAAAENLSGGEDVVRSVEDARALIERTRAERKRKEVMAPTSARLATLEREAASSRTSSTIEERKPGSHRRFARRSGGARGTNHAHGRNRG